MNSKTVGSSIVMAAIIVAAAIAIAYEEVQTENEFNVQKEKLYDAKWDEETTKNLPRHEDLGAGWTLLWSDASKEFVEGENPVIIKKSVAENVIESTSYRYSYKDIFTYQILIWKGELVSNWVPREAVENIFLQTDAKTERILEGLDLIQYCNVAYYDYYGDESEIKNDLLFSECAKKDYRVRINLVEGNFNQESIDKMVFLSNLVAGKIQN